jgi:hypothetical protein
MAKSKKGVQKGAQRHAEGQHGEKTHRALIEQLQSRPPEENENRKDTRGQHDTPGKHRLFEDREQHDEADKNREKNRLDKDIQDHGHERSNFQVRGGKASHPALPDEDPHKSDTAADKPRAPRSS